MIPQITLKDIRKAAGVPAKATGLNPRTVNRIENGSDQVSVKNLIKYLEAIGLKLTYSLSETKK